MEIERLNDSTIKFYITYKDIETRGFDREEIWYDRERGEELFFEMINEANDVENFELEGPLWIQVQALDKGLEIIVTRGQVSDGHVKLELPISKELKSAASDESTVELDEQFLKKKKTTNDADVEALDEETEYMELVIGFHDFEDVISLSHSLKVKGFSNELYHFENRYYLYVLFTDECSEDEQDDMLSQILEFGYESDLTIHRIEEYGKTIFNEAALENIRDLFEQR